MVEACLVRKRGLSAEQMQDRVDYMDSLQGALGVVPAALLREYVLGLLVLGLICLAHA